MSLTWMMRLLLLADARRHAWKVEYAEQPICAAAGSSLVILCSFYHPGNLRVTRVMWGHVKPRHPKARLVFDSDLKKAAPGFQYIGDKRSSCSLKIHRVSQSDAGKYIIALNKNRGDAWPGNTGPVLKVVDLKIVVTKTNGNETITEGDSVNLTCINACEAPNLTQAFAWFKDGAAMNDGQVLSLSNISSADSGTYTCSLKAQAGATSGAIDVDVEHGPVNTTVSVRPSPDLDAHSNLTLVCTSRSNPPVENYTWFKIGEDVMEVGHRPVLIPADRGQYFCSVTNKHGSQNSSAVSLQATFHWAPYTWNVLIAVTIALIATAAVAVRWLKEKSTWAPETDGEDTQCQKSDFIFGANRLQQENPPPVGGASQLVYVMLDFSNTRQPNTGQHSDRGEDLIYSTAH